MSEMMSEGHFSSARHAEHKHKMHYNQTHAFYIYIYIYIFRTFGFELPANPAFNVDVPLSITTGWFNRRELPVSPSAPGVSSDDMILADVVDEVTKKTYLIFLFVCLFVCLRFCITSPPRSNFKKKKSDTDARETKMPTATTTK
jgi:hypothetical protein